MSGVLTNGRRLAVQAEAGHVGHLAGRSASGDGVKLAAHTDAYRDEPAWFRRTASRVPERSHRGEIWTMNADGSEAHQITR